MTQAAARSAVEDARSGEKSADAIAVLLPCFNEEASIGEVVRSFRRELPTATIYVYDNNSTDRTAEQASAAGAIVRRERQQGKGSVLRRMFADIEADIYVMADGDLTYDTSVAPALIAALVADNVDMVVGVRVATGDAYRRGHRWGNRLFNVIVRKLFGPGFTDILSGYRVLSRRFVKSFPATSSGFEVESELSVHALDLRLSTAEIPVHYGSRPANSESKLRTWRDGIRILLMIARMYRNLYPIRFFGILAMALAGLSILLGAPVVADYFATGQVPRLPTAVLSAAIMQLAFLALTCGVVLDAIAGMQRETKRLRYLALPSPAARGSGGEAAAEASERARRQ